MLGILPTELIQLVLHHCDTSTFLQAAYCCRTLLEIASSSRDLLLHHLTQTPGWNDGIEDLSRRRLFKLLLERSHQELFGAEFYVRPTPLNFEGKRVDSRASSLRVVDDSLMVLLAFKGDDSIALCEMKDGTLNRSLHLLPPGKQYGETEILQTAIETDCVWMLHRFKPFVGQDLDTSHPFVKQALRSNTQGSVFLAWYDVQNWNQAPLMRLYGFHNQSGYEPLALAVNGRNFAISWQHAQRSQDHQVVLYSKIEDEDTEDNYMEDEVEGGEQKDEAATSSNPYKAKEIPVIESRYHSYLLTEASQVDCSHAIVREKGPTRKLSFNDRGHQLLHQYGGHTLYGSYQILLGLPRVGYSPPTARENACIVRFLGSLSLSFSIGIPFFGTHNTNPFQNTCHWQYLSIGIATHRVEHWTVACVLRTEARPRSTRCGGSGHLWNLERGRRLDNWHVVAQLGGFQESDTSHGSIIATSPLGTRVAIASWKTVSIWVLEPNMLVEEEFSYYPESWQTPDSYPVLRPAVIQLDGVCSQLSFTDKEDELLVITDRGLVCLDLRSNSRTMQLIEDAGSDASEDGTDRSE